MVVTRLWAVLLQIELVLVFTSLVRANIQLAVLGHYWRFLDSRRFFLLLLLLRLLLLSCIEVSGCLHLFYMVVFDRFRCVCHHL